jgi:hypothetical protein
MPTSDTSMVLRQGGAPWGVRRRLVQRPIAMSPWSATYAGSSVRGHRYSWQGRHGPVTSTTGGRDRAGRVCGVAPT